MDTDRIVELETEPQEEPQQAQLVPGGPRVPSWAVVLVVAAAFFGLCLAQSLTTPWNGDTASMSLQGWALAHGHLMLHGWWSSDVNFYTLDTPLYGLSLLVFGFGGMALHIAGALLYTLVFLSAAWLAKGREAGARAWLRVALTALLLTAPLFHGALLSLLILVPDHCGTVTFALVSFTLFSRFTDRRWAPWALLLVLTLGQLGDATVRYVPVPALLAVWLIDTLIERRLRSPRHWSALAAAASVPLSLLLRKVMRDHGAYYLTQLHNQVAPRSDWGWHLHDTWLSLLSLFNVKTSFSGYGGWENAASVLGALALVCGIGSLLYTFARWTKVDVADHLLAVATVVYLSAYAFSTVTLHGGGGGYEFIGVMMFLGTLSARTIPRLRVPRLKLGEQGRQRAVVRATAVAAAGAVVFLVSGSGLLVTSQTAPAQQVADWLVQHNLKYGLGGYWNAAPVTIYSGYRVQVRQIIPEPSGFTPYAWNSMRQWYDPAKNDANFVIAGPGPAFTSVTTDAAVAMFGRPSAEYPVDGLTVMVYSYNLLTRGSMPILPPGA